MKNRVFIFLLLVSIVTSNVYSQKKPVPDNTSKYQTIESKAGMWALRLPPSFKVTKTHFTVSDYVTNEILNVKLQVPQLSPSDKNDNSWNAVQIECPNGEFATVFSIQGSLASMQELMIRAEDARDAVASTRGIKREDVFLAYIGSEYFAGTMATNSDIQTAIKNKDSLHTHIALTTVSGYTFGIIMRAPKSMRDIFVNASVNNYRMIANNFQVMPLFQSVQHVVNTEGRWSVNVPTAWNIIKKHVPNPIVPNPNDALSADTTHWNVLYAQVSSTQIEISVHDSTEPRTKEQLRQDINRFILNPTPDVVNSITARNTTVIAGLPTTTLSFIAPRRDNIVRQIIHVAYKNNKQYFVRGICWDRDTPIMENILNEVCKRIAVAP